MEDAAEEVVEAVAVVVEEADVAVKDAAAAGHSDGGARFGYDRVD